MDFHIEKNTYKCSQCDESFLTDTDMNIHIKHTQEKYFTWIIFIIFFYILNICLFILVISSIDFLC